MGQRPPSTMGLTEVMTTRDHDLGMSEVREDVEEAELEELIQTECEIG
jgi:hypothetical protein